MYTCFIPYFNYKGEEFGSWRPFPLLYQKKEENNTSWSYIYLIWNVNRINLNTYTRVFIHDERMHTLIAFHCHQFKMRILFKNGLESCRYKIYECVILRDETINFNLPIAVEFRISRKKKQLSTLFWERIDSWDTSNRVRWSTRNKSILRSCFMDAETKLPHFIMCLDSCI